MEPETHNITGVDFAFEGVPDEVAVGSDFTLANESHVEVHEIVLMRLPDDEERSVNDLVQLPPEELLPILAPGTIGADPDEFMAAAAEGGGPPDVDGGPPHVAEGMYAEFTVE